MKKDIKSVVFISNFFNHHQRPFSDAMYELLGEGYMFLETESITHERLNMGWGEQKLPGYVIPVRMFEEQRDKVQWLIDDADAVIFGSAPSELLRNRIQDDKMIFRYTERLLKIKEPWKYPVRLFTWRKAWPQKKHTFVLCASAYTAGDFAQFGLYRNRCYKWGYFPETKIYDIDELIAKKQEKSCPMILWAGRLIGLKHPEAAVMLAERLKIDGYQFELNIIGNGEMEEQLHGMIREKGLSDCVHMLGAMQPEQVRKYMERADIYLFTSDFHEGWGAVLNESMNSGCAVVASFAIGSVPFLIRDGENGLIYKNGDDLSIYDHIVQLLEQPELRKKLGSNAYRTISKKWNAKIAAERFVELYRLLKAGEGTRYEDGPCSEASNLYDWNMYKQCKGIKR